MQEINAVQKKWLQLLQQARENELATGALYQLYAELFPEHEGTWATLARAEAVHARLLEELLGKEAPAIHTIPFDKLNTNTMDFITGQLAVMQENAMSGKVTVKRAIANALILESSLVESFLYTAAPPGSQFSVVAEQLAKESNYHREMVLKLRDGMIPTPPGASTVTDKIGRAHV